MTPLVNLHILAKTYTQLSRSAYFDPAFREFSDKTVEAINHVIDNVEVYPEEVIRQFEQHVWRVMQFVRGSRSNDAPHETQYVLKKALKEWISDDAIISSAALEELNFFLNPADLWDFVATSLGSFDADSYKPLVVQIGAPEAYKHRPVFCVPLFHELGHFVDCHFKVSEISMLLNPPQFPTSMPNGPQKNMAKQMIQLHRMEYFADLFSSCYCGEAGTEFLKRIAPDNPDSHTHPSTKKRVAVVDDFLNDRDNPTVDLIQNALKSRGMQEFKPWYKVPDIVPSFNDVVTYRVQDDQELYGIFLAGWNYLNDQLESKSAPWVEEGLDTYTVEKTTNDLIEKSIRNYEIRERWADVTANQS